MENPKASLNDIREFLKDEENVIAIADALFSSKGPTKYDVVEIKYTEEGEFKKHARCSKGKHIDAWFHDAQNRERAKLPEVAEEDVNMLIKIVMEQLIESKLIHCAEKPDNARRIIYSDSLVWNSKLVYSWDYDGPAGMRYLKTGLTLLAIIAIPTYRIWPRFLQNIVFYIAVTLLVAMLGLEIIRFILFCICYLFGWRVWIFPDLDRDDKGILGIFTPLISVEKIEDGYNKYRYIAVGVIGAIIALYAYNPRGFVKGVITVYNDGYYVVQYVRGVWMSCKLAIVNYLKTTKPNKSNVEVKKSPIPTYDPDEDALYDFVDENVQEEEMLDLEDLDDVKLEVE